MCPLTAICRLPPTHCLEQQSRLLVMATGGECGTKLHCVDVTIIMCHDECVGGECQVRLFTYFCSAAVCWVLLLARHLIEAAWRGTAAGPHLRHGDLFYVVQHNSVTTYSVTHYCCT